MFGCNAYLCVCLEHTPVEVVGDLPAVLYLRNHVLEGRPTVHERRVRGVECVHRLMKA